MGGPAHSKPGLAERLSRVENPVVREISKRCARTPTPDSTPRDCGLLRLRYAAAVSVAAAAAAPNRVDC